MAEKQIVLTLAERERLEKEYRNLIDKERPDVIEKLQIARSQGDLSENADYDAARDRQAQIENRIREIEEIFRVAVDAEEVISTDNADIINIGFVVSFSEKGSKDKKTVRIAGNTGADPFAEIPAVSNESPIGKALIGHKKGESVIVECAAPYEIKIISADYE
ncbi:MAG: transcription elongation factor GreA [Bacilli bacterium]|nr:transcription elongation factor GreA [Bacilli bacterium]